MIYCAKPQATYVRRVVKPHIANYPMHAQSYGDKRFGIVVFLSILVINSLPVFSWWLKHAGQNELKIMMCCAKPQATYVASANYLDERFFSIIYCLTIAN